MRRKRHHKRINELNSPRSSEAQESQITNSLKSVITNEKESHAEKYTSEKFKESFLIYLLTL